jgi:glycine cleavage system aminomethyltransferase T
VPVYVNEKQIGKATTTAFSPLLKKLIALASVNTEHSKPGMKLQMELTIEAQRMTTTATVVPLPFFNPKRKTAVPV